MLSKITALAPSFLSTVLLFCSGPARTHGPALPRGCKTKFLACTASCCAQGTGSPEQRCGCGSSFCSTYACHNPMYYICIEYLYRQLQLLRSGHAMAMGAFVQPRTWERWGTGPRLKIMTIQGTHSMVWDHQRPQWMDGDRLKSLPNGAGKGRGPERLGSMDWGNQTALLVR